MIMRDPALQEFFAGQQVLVTGASGFIGWHVADQLVQAGAQSARSGSPGDGAKRRSVRVVRRRSVAARLARRGGERLPVRVPCRGRLSLLGAGSEGNFREQRAGDDQCPRGSQVGRGGENRLHQHHRHPGKRNGGAPRDRRTARLACRHLPGRTSARSSKPFAKRKNAPTPDGRS